MQFDGERKYKHNNVGERNQRIFIFLLNVYLERCLPSNVRVINYIVLWKIIENRELNLRTRLH